MPRPDSRPFLLACSEGPGLDQKSPQCTWDWLSLGRTGVSARGSPTTGTPNSSADITTNQLQSEQPNDQTVEPYGEVPDQRCGPTDHQPHQGEPTPMALRSRQRPPRSFNLQLISSCRQYLKPRRRQCLDRLTLVSSPVLLRESPETIEHWAQSSQDGTLKPRNGQGVDRTDNTSARTRLRARQWRTSFIRLTALNLVLL
jgi:hypothetical protein